MSNGRKSNRFFLSRHNREKVDNIERRIALAWREFFGFSGLARLGQICRSVFLPVSRVGDV